MITHKPLFFLLALLLTIPFSFLTSKAAVAVTVLEKEIQTEE